MVTSISSMYLQISLLILCLLSSSRNTYAEHVSSESQSSGSYVVPLSYLLPPNFCNPSPKARGKASFELVNNYGPCSKHNQGKASPLSFSQIRQHDEARINYIRSRRQSALKQTQDFTVPTSPGLAIGAFNYFIKVGLGTPKQEFSIAIDTGSEYTWTQCQPCTNGCYQQFDPIFNPTKSKTFRNIPCTSSFCKQAQGSFCSSDSKSCRYGFGYVDRSTVSGSLAKETLTIKSADDKSSSVSDFVFLCAYNVTAETSDGTAGIMGLDRGPASFVSQSSSLYENYFSYCLPSYVSNSTGYLTFGKTDDFTNIFVKFTPLTPNSVQSYDIEITGLSVAGKKLPIPTSVFKEGQTIIDSGTVITRLQTAAYKVLKSAFRKKMSKYKMASDDSFDTCYDFSGYDSFDKVTIPKISIFFKGGVEMEVDARGIMVPTDGNIFCLAFAGTGDFLTNDVLIGNYQQQGIEVHYDVAGRQIGFGARGC